MQYQGGKEKIAKHIVAALTEYIPGHDRYLEPFMGGASIASRMAPLFPGAATLADFDPDLAALWLAARDGWEPPTVVTREDYAAAKADTYPSAYRAFVAYGCSFGGRKWSSYATNARGDDFAGAARRGVLKKARGLQGATILQADYRDGLGGTGLLRPALRRNSRIPRRGRMGRRGVLGNDDALDECGRDGCGLRVRRPRRLGDDLGGPEAGQSQRAR